MQKHNLFSGGINQVTEEFSPQEKNALYKIDFDGETSEPYIIWNKKYEDVIRFLKQPKSSESAYYKLQHMMLSIISHEIMMQTLAGVAGVMLASRLQSGQPTAGEFYELLAIAAVVLGGASLYGGEGRLYKSMIGVFIMVVLSNSLNLLNVNSYWQRVAIGAVIISAAAADMVKSRK